MEILIILGVIFLFFKYKNTQKSNAAFERSQNRFNDEFYFEKVRREQEDDKLEKDTLELLVLFKKGIITQEEFDQGIEDIQNRRESINVNFPHKFSQEELEEMVEDVKYLEKIIK